MKDWLGAPGNDRLETALSHIGNNVIFLLKQALKQDADYTEIRAGNRIHWRAEVLEIIQNQLFQAIETKLVQTLGFAHPFVLLS